MTTVLETPAPAAPAPVRHSRRLWAAVPWLLPAISAYWVLHYYDTPDKQIALYAVYLLLAVVVPGTLVFRAAFGSRGNLPEDLGLGAATGLLVLLAGWALAAATGLQHLLIGWPALVMALFAAVPGLRRHWRTGPGEPLPIGWSAAMAVVLFMVTIWGATVFRTVPLPPHTAELYPDLYYHLALVHEMTRSMPFQVPQLAGETLKYHYLSDADIATASMITGIDAHVVFLRLWVMPVAAIAVLVFAALARSVSGRWWAAPIAATVGFVGQSVTVGSIASPPGIGLPITLLSPSQTYAMPLIGIFVLVAADVLRGKALRWWGWALLPLLAVACAGSKASVLPPLAAGLLLAGAISLIGKRKIPWTTIALLATVGFGMVVGLKLFAGGGAGTLQPQFLATMRWFLPYQDVIGTADDVQWGGLVQDGLESAGTAARWFVAWSLIWWFLVQAPRLVGLALPPKVRWSRPRQWADDQVPWLLGGIVIAGVLGMWLLWHPSASQIYFYNAVLPVCGVLTAWALADRVRGRLVPVLGAVAGGLWEFFAPALTVPVSRDAGGWAWAMALPLIRTAALVAVISLIAVLIWRKRAARALSTALIAAIAAAGTVSAVTRTVESLGDPPAIKVRNHVAVTAAEMKAALWLEANVGKDDLVATNVHCMPMSAQQCNARAFWVAGLGGHRTLVESWAYTDRTVAANGVNDLKYFFQPAPDPAVFALNQRVFEKGLAADVQELRSSYGVRWLFADTAAGKVANAPLKAAGAVVVHQIGTVVIYRLY
ncbi:hypothetical protein ACTI_25040 [Actinoplanes sp. OR16]|uniref:hypothetical protein n=1 Tax=Actinoplanes sp. OR16 TaxID=946334 RepID=UPI000F70A7C7|nr:hypothetical protein [Actinoplanes sp. OR16]BBH65819.1 hypothetical protein ACTI_25040 [Actinoplanes sp. OR16]